MAKVMVVDDAQSDLKLMESILRGAGHEVVSLTDGESSRIRCRPSIPTCCCWTSSCRVATATRSCGHCAATRARARRRWCSCRRRIRRATGLGQEAGRRRVLSKPFTSDQLLSVVSRFAR